jgi:hypothetical protein
MGFAGGAGVVLSMAVVVDRTTGDRAARLFSSRYSRRKE